jgi:hypothetical protein
MLGWSHESYLKNHDGVFLESYLKNHDGVFLVTTEKII